VQCITATFLRCLSPLLALLSQAIDCGGNAKRMKAIAEYYGLNITKFLLTHAVRSAPRPPGCRARLLHKPPS